MSRMLLVALMLALAGCGTSASDTSEPEGLAMTDPLTETVDTTPDFDTLTIDLGDERLTLRAGICNTFDNGTFRFALAEGVVGTTGRVTATVERFDTGAGYELVVAVEGQRDDGTEFSWYARSGLPVHRVTVSIFGSTIEGSAIFDSIGGPDAPGIKAEGHFAIRCQSIVDQAP